MEKIKSLFQRNYETNRLVRNEVVPGSEWVQAGEGIATRKYDGTCCMIKDGVIYARYDAKNGKTPPNGFIPAQDPDEITGHWPGWIDCRSNPNGYKWHLETFERLSKALAILGERFLDGTYELIGPKVQGNPEGYQLHHLQRHSDAEQYPDAPRTFNELKEWFADKNIEGIVWHHPDGRMVKIKKKDFGMKR